ncbi:MAG: hypothetical protein EON87_01165 [Brevundimonas sp.]|nr:MAG: hypothetical protein EON87_01165 [Brevundimonas sp.]
MAVARALVSSGEPVSPSKVYAWLETNGLRRTGTAPSGAVSDQQFQKEIRFARQELADGRLVRSINGRWAAVQIDELLRLTPDRAREMISRNRRDREDRRSKGEQTAQASVLRHSGPSPTTGPRPSEWTSIMRRTDGRASTYAFRFGETNLWKIGFASRVDARLREVNRHVPTELGGSAWAKVHTTQWPSQLAAYAMEQEVLQRLTRERTVFERAWCTPERLKAIWGSARTAIAVQQRISHVAQD